MSPKFTESVVEDAAIEWLEEVGYQPLAADQTGRSSNDQVILTNTLRDALARLNPHIPTEGIDEAVRKLETVSSPQLVSANHAFHRYIVDGVTIEYLRADGSIGYDPVRVLDFDEPTNNDLRVVRQLRIAGNLGGTPRIPDLILFVNGLPLVVFELKNAATESATLTGAFNQLQTYKLQIPDLFIANALLVISDGVEARVGTLSANLERFQPWRTIEGESLAPASLSELEVLIRGALMPARLLAIIRSYVVFERADDTVIKKVAGYHQLHAVDRAVEATLAASSVTGDRRVGVVWHTQGSGKSLTMAFYAGRVALHPAMQNPTLVILTDRNDLDDQLFGTFARCAELMRQDPVRATDRAKLRELLQVSSGGVVFTTIQKFLPVPGEAYPTLTERKNVIVIADEAHRSQYDFIDGFASHMRKALPNASFIGFTGTPIESGDKNTRAVFGDYISVYDIKRAVEDGATVPIYYESRLAKLQLDQAQKANLDDAFDAVTEGEEDAAKERLKTKWSALEAIVGAEPRIAVIANDLVRHFEARLGTMEGKGLVVCMSRRICVELYRALVALRPDWHGDGDDSGQIKVVMTGSAADPADWQAHIRNKARLEKLAARVKDPADPLRLVIVRDMWLTGFDAPCLHTMYLDKPMRGHGLMQAIARVNRVFRDKPGGLVVDYLGLAEPLRDALATYTASGGEGDAALDQAEAVALMLERYEKLCDLFHGFDRSAWMTGQASARLSLMPAAQEKVLGQKDGKKHFVQLVTELGKAFALAVPHEEVLRIKDDVGFFQAVKAALTKRLGGSGKRPEELDHAIRQIVSGAMADGEVVDVFAEAGLRKPDLSILSDEFLDEVQGLTHKNLAVELLRKLLSGEVKTRGEKNVVQGRSFAALLEGAMLRYQNRAVEAAQVIEELIALAKSIKDADRRGENLGLTADEIAFYDALEANESAAQVMGDASLRIIAKELVAVVRKSVTIDWTVKESVRAKLRVVVKRILRKYGYPPDLQEAATTLVLQQAELLSSGWAMSAEASA